MKVVDKKSKQEAAAPVEPVFKFKFGDKVRVVDHDFCEGAEGRVVDFYVDQGKYEIWVQIGTSTKAIHMEPKFLVKVYAKEPQNENSN